jgi:hypothetical protein
MGIVVLLSEFVYATVAVSDPTRRLLASSTSPHEDVEFSGSPIVLRFFCCLVRGVARVLDGSQTCL